ncbi:MAG: hypothetical protein A2Y07_10785 [Planctomycetes bacterium GWF2_50_10]|nr:MAG: hypothetical protein A2Y07_10785 [Planctomycetes bacterium GWF2_50_10]
MSHENKIDFIMKPENSFLYSNDFMSNHFRQFSVIIDIHSELDQNFDGFVVSLVTFAYFRINGIAANNVLHIPKKASPDNLSYNEGDNFFVDIFNHYKIICEANEVLKSTVSILEPFFMAGAENLPSEFQKNIAKELLELDWSDRGFTNQECGLYVEGDLIRDILVDATTDCVYPDFYLHLYHLAPLLNIRSDEKQLCTPILYNTYLINIFEQLGWPKNGHEKLIKKHLNNVTTVQADPVLWAIHTIEVLLFGYKEKLLSGANDLATISGKASSRFDVIVLPEVSNDTIPDIGPIAVGNVIIEKASYLNNLYYVAFLYNLLNDNGRMLIRFDHNAETALNRDSDKLLTYFLDHNVIEAVIQTNNCTYMLIDKNRPEEHHGRVLFYFGAYFRKLENVDSCLKQFSCEDINITHDEGACIVSNQEIRLNDYCLLPKKYIYDFDRITANAEFHVVRHIAHDLSPKLSTVDSVLKHLTRFIESRELLHEPLQEQFYEGQTLEPVGEAIDKARSEISQMHKLIKDTRKVITEEIPMEEFSSVNLSDFLEATKKKYANDNITLDIDCDQDIQYEMHATSFAEMIDNFVRNAEVHGFEKASSRTECKIAIVVTKRKNDPNLIVEIKNNGNPLPDELTVEKYIGFGNRGKNSPGDGLGGAYIYKVIQAHRGILEIIRDDKEYLVNFKITLPHLEGNK